MSLSMHRILAVSVPLVFAAAIHTGAWANPANGADVLRAATDGQERRADEASVRACKHDSDSRQDNGRRWGRGHANDGDKDRGDHDRGHRARGDNDQGDRGRRNKDRDDDNDRSGSPPVSSHPGTTAPSSVPEPGVLGLFSLGLLGTVLAPRRRRTPLG
jgi:hypothetical protein